MGRQSYYTANYKFLPAQYENGLSMNMQLLLTTNILFSLELLRELFSLVQSFLCTIPLLTVKNPQTFKKLACQLY